MSRCYAVASGKGGVGKSIITANCAAVLAQNGSSVVIVDADIGLRSQDALLSLENRVVYDLIDVANEECTLDQAILSCESIPALHLLPAAQFDRAKALNPKRFSRILCDLRNLYDYIFVDCPAGIERGLRNVLNAGVDDAILVVTPDDISLRSAERTVQLMNEKKTTRPLLVVNRLDPQLLRAHEMMSAQAVSQILDLQLIGVIPEDPVVYRSILKHDLLIHFDCDARNAILRLAARLQGRIVPIPAFRTRKSNLFHRILHRSVKEVTPIDDH